MNNGPARDSSDDLNPDYEDLTLAQKKALNMSMTYLYDTYMEDLHFLSSGNADFEETFMSTALPPRYSTSYNYLFAKKFFACFVAATERIRNSEHPLCLAEEMAAKQIIDHAISMTEDMGPKSKKLVKSIVEGLRGFEEDLFEDTDFLFLWDGQFDGIEYIQELGMANLEISKWFNAFRKERPVNPYVEEDEPGDTQKELL